MAGKRLLAYLQLGKEVTAGTSVAATRRMETDLTSAFTVDWMKTYHEGRMTGYNNPVSFSTQQGTRVDIAYRTPSDTGIAFDLLPFFNIFPGGGTAGTSSGGAGGTTYTWSAAWGGTVGGSAVSYTFEFGDDTQEYEAEYCQAIRQRVSSEVGGLTQLEADFVGRQSTKSTRTSLLNSGALARIPGYLWTASFSTAASTLAAATAQVNFLLSWDADWQTGLVPRFYQDGNAYFGQTQQSAPHSGNLHMVVSSSSSAVSRFYDKGAAGTIDFVRLATGTANAPIVAGGTPYQAIYEFAVDYTNVVPLGGEIDGENTYDVTARIVLDTTWGQAQGATVVCALPTLSA